MTGSDKASIRNSHGKKAILNNLNNMINMNKEYYESLKFKLVTDTRNKKKATSIERAALQQDVSNESNATDQVISVSKL
jgi:hypothetical protein